MQEIRMAEPQNLANAAIIIAPIYFMFQTGFNWWLAALIGFGLIKEPKNHGQRITERNIGPRKANHPGIKGSMEKNHIHTEENNQKKAKKK